MGELLMNKPEYQSNSIVNLMSSILNAFNCENNYAPLSRFDIDLNKYQHIVCMVVDGLGYNFLKKHNNSFLHQHLKQKNYICFSYNNCQRSNGFSYGTGTFTTWLNRLVHVFQRVSNSWCLFTFST